MLRLKSFHQIERFKNTEVVIDLDKICYVYNRNNGLFTLCFSPSHKNPNEELTVSETEITFDKFVKKWKGEE
jgi:hypothetical protein